MAKKNFQSAPKPKNSVSPEAIEAFENGGAGHDRPRKAVNNLQEPTRRLSVDLPQTMHLRFKTACSATQRKMTKEIEAFISGRTKELEEEAGITHK